MSDPECRRRRKKHAAVAAVGFVICLPLLIIVLVSGPEAAPEEGSGIVAPRVADGLPADFEFRWPTPARATVTMRIEAPMLAVVLRAVVELGPLDTTGERRFLQGRFEPIWIRPGLEGSADFTMPAGRVRVRDGKSIDMPPLVRWREWVEDWLTIASMLRDREEASLVDTSSPETETTVTRSGASRTGSVRMVMRTVATSQEGVDALTRKSDPTSVRDGDKVSEVRFEIELDPRTMQPIRVVRSLAYTPSGRRSRTVFEFDWSATNAQSPAEVAH